MFPDIYKTAVYVKSIKKRIHALFLLLMKFETGSKNIPLFCAVTQLNIKEELEIMRYLSDNNG